MYRFSCYTLFIADHAFQCNVVENGKLFGFVNLYV